MALILVVEQENRYIERIRDALTSEGWQVRAVGGSQEALSTAEREPPQLVLVSRESEGCDRLFQAFSRRTGGPGVVALLPESATDLEEPAADDALAKPFTDQDLRLAVRRGLKPKTSPPATAPASQPPDGGRQLSAQDIFGDVVAEVESEIQGGPGAAASPSPTPTGPPTPPREAPKARDHAAPEPRPKRSGELDLEKTLSGLRRDVELGSRPDRPSPTEAPGPGTSTAGLAREPGPVRPGTAPRRKKKTDTELDVDALLSETLSGFDLPSKKKKRSPPPPDPESVPEPPTGPEPPMGVEPPMEAEPTPGEAEVSLADLLADEDDVPPPTQVQPPPDLVAPPSSTPGPRTGDRGGDGVGVGAAEPGVVAGGGEPPAPLRTQPSEEPSQGPREEPRKGPEVREISFSDLSAPSLQEVPEPLTPDPGAGPEIGPEPDELREMEAGSGSGAPQPEAPGGDELQERSRTGYSLADWLESGEDSMFVPDESPGPTGMPQTPAAESGDAGPPTSGELSAPTGRRFGQYTLLDRIAVGGMAEVWKARSTGIEGFQKTVAIKKILPHLTDNDDFVNMFVDEAKLAAQLSHPNIIHIYDLGKIGDHFYIAMEYVEGKNLRALLNESRRKALPLPRGLALLIAARLASALDHAHRKKDFEDRELGLVHRDVSPQNVLISDEGDIKLCDFGIVKAVSKVSQTQMGALKGKLQYMSPEQAWGKEVDGRSDLFSLGAILFEMLTGRRLFAGDSEISVLEAVRQCRVVAPRELVPQIPEKVEAITLKALAMAPGDRYQTAGEMQGELEDVLYSVKPAPSPADLAEFLSRLAQAPEVDESDLVRPPLAAAGQVSTGGAVASGAERPVESPREEGPGDGEPAAEKVAGPGREALSSLPPLDDSGRAERPGPERPTGSGVSSGPDRPSAATGSGAGSVAGPRASPGHFAATAMPAMADYDLYELEEGGGRGKLWLVVLIVALLAAGAAAFYYLYFVRPPSTAPREVPEAEAPTEPAPSPLDEVEPETLDDAEEGAGDPIGELGEEEGSAAASASSATRSPPAPDREPERPSGPPRTATTRPAEGDPGSTTVASPPTRTPPTQVAGTRATTTRSPTEPRSTPPRPSQRGPTPGVVAESQDPSPAAATGTDASARTGAATPQEPETRAGPSSPQTPFALREGASPASSPAPSSIRPASSEAVDGPASGANRPQEVVALRRPTEPVTEPETESTESAPEMESGAETAETRPPAEPGPQPPQETEVREGDLVGPGPGVTAPVLVRFDKPSYPPLARRMKVEGDVVVSLLVDETGRVLEARLIQGVREGVGLHQVALDAARRARYRPATKNGVRVKMWTTLKIPFRL